MVGKIGAEKSGGYSCFFSDFRNAAGGRGIGQQGGRRAVQVIFFEKSPCVGWCYDMGLYLFWTLLAE